MATAYADIIIRAKGESIAADLGKVTQSFKRIEGSVESLGRQMSAVGSIIGVSFGVQGIKNLITSADAFKSLEARIRGITSQTGDFESVSETLRSISRETGAPLETTVSVFQSLARSRVDLGATNAQMLTLTQLVQQLGVIGGASTGAMQAGLMQFSQAMAGGIVRAEEWNSILENLPELANAIAAGMGKSVSGLRQMVLQGKLLSTDVFKVLLGQSAEIQARFEQMPVTAERGWNALTQSLTVALAAMDKQTGLTDYIGRGLMGWARYLDPTDAERYNQLLAERARLEAVPAKSTEQYNRIIDINKETAALRAEKEKQQRAEAAAESKMINLSVTQKLRLQDQQNEVKALTASYDKLVKSIRDSQLEAKAPAQKDVKDSNVLDINRLRDQAQGYIGLGKGAEDFQKALPLLQQAAKINESLLASGQISKTYYMTQADLLLKLAEAGRAVQAGEKPGVALGIEPVANEQANALYLEQSRAFWEQNPAYQPVVPVFSEYGTMDIGAGENLAAPQLQAYPGFYAPELAAGGLLRGAGTGTSDSLLARVSNGEYVVNAAATRQYLPLLQSINRLRLPRFATGGAVSASPTASYRFDLNGRSISGSGQAAEVTAFASELRREVLRRGKR